MAQVLKSGALYFVTVFGAGFVFGTFRVLWLVPRVGERAAELVESPFMLVVSAVAARWVLHRIPNRTSTAQRLGIGLVALALLLVAEVLVVVLIRGVSLAEYITIRDKVSGTVYLGLLGLFAIMPLVVARR